jgi:Uma2 family endonuclease
MKQQRDGRGGMAGSCAIPPSIRGPVRNIPPLRRTIPVTVPTGPGGILECAPLRFLSRRADLMGMAAPTYYTADMVRALPDDGQRYELVHGELLVTPAPRAWHQEIVGRLFEALRAYLRDREAGHALMSPADISWTDDTLVQPDVFVVDLAEARTLDWARMKTLLLAVEVLSPSTARADRFTKRRLYQEVGVPTYWIVDPERCCVEVWRPEVTFPVIEWAEVSWQPAGAGEPLRLSLAELFRPI